MFKYIIILIIIFYTFMYYIANSGYYEYHMQEKTRLTNQKIKEFEEDVRNNKDIDIKDYLDYEDKDYTNRLTLLVYNMNIKSNEITRKILKSLLKKLNNFVKE